MYGLIAVAAVIAGFLAIFTQFAPYDDEGTLLVTLDAFVRGDALYRDIYSIYGPFYYELFGSLFALTGMAATTDVSRSIVVVAWVATALLYGVAMQRLTDSLVLGGTTMVVAFGALGTLVGEPMHPHGLGVVLLGLFTLLVTFGPSRRFLWTGFFCGVLLAALVLTKINLGAFALAAIALAAALTVLPRSWRWLQWPVIAVFLAMPLAIAARDVDVGWVRDLVALETLSMVAIVIAAWPLRTATGQEPRLFRWLLAGATGFALAFVAIVGGILLTGPSPGDVYDGVVIEAIRVRDVLVTPIPLSPAPVLWGAIAVAASILVVRSATRWGAAASIWPGLLRVAVGLTIWIAVTGLAPAAIGPLAHTPVFVPMILAWVAAIPSVAESPHRSFLRVLFPALAVAWTLQVYPVAGSQMGIAALAYVTVGALCLADGLKELQTWALGRGGPEWMRTAITAAAVVVTAAFALGSIARPAISNARDYGDRNELPLRGAALLRLPTAEAEIYTDLVALLHRHRCTSFIGYPNINSLYIWSNINPPPPAAPGAWIEALDGDFQKRAVDELRAEPRPCAIRSLTRAGLWLRGEPPPDLPLVRYVFERFESVAEVGDFEFMLPKPEA